MTTTAPAQKRQRQSELNMHVPVRSPLMPMKAAMWLLERDENHILAAIPDRIRWAFDLHCKGERAMVLIFRASAEHCRDLDHQKTPTPELETVEYVINSVLPQRPIFRAVEIKNLFHCNQGHIANLIDIGLLRVAPHSPSGPKVSPLVLRESIAELLTNRRYLP